MQDEADSVSSRDIHPFPSKSPSTSSRLVVDCEAMNIQVAVVCDAAADYGGKLNILGAFDTIFAASFPATHPQCAIALRLVFQRIEEGSHKLRLNFVNEDGRFVLPSIEIPVEVVFPGDVSDLVRNFIFNIQQLKFDQPGQYAIDLALDGRQEASILIRVQQQQGAST